MLCIETSESMNAVGVSVPALSQLLNGRYVHRWTFSSSTAIQLSGYKRFSAKTSSEIVTFQTPNEFYHTTQ